MYMFDIKDMDLTHELTLDLKEKINDVEVFNYSGKNYVCLGLETGEIMFLNYQSIFE